jgi:Right handed beta helix region
MAFPVILVDSANALGGTASDSAASGAGPATALTGSAGVSAGDGLSVTLDGSPDISGLATDGSAVLYFADATAGNLNFAKITGANNGTKVVTVANALGTTLTKAWAIGGARATIAGTNSLKLFSNNSSSGDAMPGWAIEMQSGHTETLSANFILRRAGDLTSGPIILRGKSGAATIPVITFSNNGAAFTTNAAYQQLRDFEIQNSNATKTASIAITCAALHHVFDGMKIVHATNKFWKGVLAAASETFQLLNSSIKNCASNGVDVTGASARLRIGNCLIKSCGGAGISAATSNQLWITDCIIAGNTGDGLTWTSTIGSLLVRDSTIDANGANGVTISGILASTTNISIINNSISNNVYGVAFTDAGSTAPCLNALGVKVDYNNTYTHSSGAYLPTGFGTNDPGLNPTFTATASDDYSIGTNLKAQGMPLGGSKYIGNFSTTYSYNDIGVAQRQEAGGTSPVGRQLIKQPVGIY